MNAGVCFGKLNQRQLSDSVRYKINRKMKYIVCILHECYEAYSSSNGVS